MAFIDLEYVPDSCVGPLNLDELHAFERWLNNSDRVPMAFDPAYVHHLMRFHGGIPTKRCFRTRGGRERLIERFLNYLPDGESELMDYNTTVMWVNVCERLGGYLLPFATLFAGDLLCFDYRKEGRPKIVVWGHEQSRPNFPPVTDPVAEDFDRFLELLYAPTALI